jgi:hypothetical protein
MTARQAATLSAWLCCLTRLAILDWRAMSNFCGSLAAVTFGAVGNSAARQSHRA